MNPLDIILPNSDLVLFWPMNVVRVFKVEDDCENGTYPSDLEVSDFDGYILDKHLVQLTTQAEGGTFHFDDRYYIIDKCSEDVRRNRMAARDTGISLIPVTIVARCFFPE